MSVPREGMLLFVFVLYHVLLLLPIMTTLSSCISRSTSQPKHGYDYNRIAYPTPKGHHPPLHKVTRHVVLAVPAPSAHLHFGSKTGAIHRAAPNAADDRIESN